MVVALGFFDGVHIAHRYLINKALEEAKKRADDCRIITFWPHPKQVLFDGVKNFSLLSSQEEKLAEISALGVKQIEVLEFTKEFARLSTEDFLKQYILGDGERVHKLILGYDSRMGFACNGPMDIIRVCRKLGIETLLLDSYNVDGQAVSSTRIRHSLLRGDLKFANDLLGYNYSLNGIVVEGDRIGRTIGFPTANLKPDFSYKLIPAIGVYLVVVNIAEESFYGMCCIGRRPTVTNAGLITIETNIFNFNRDIYGCHINVEFLRLIRGEEKFNSLEALQAKISEDKMICQYLLNNSKILINKNRR